MMLFFKVISVLRCNWLRLAWIKHFALANCNNHISFFLETCDESLKEPN